MCFTWRGSVRDQEVVNLGPLALLHPLLERLQVADIIDRHLPPDPQLEFSHGQVLSLLLAARLASPTALVNIPAWAEKTGADILWNIPAAKLNDDRLGRALDAFFTQRHSILACVAEQVLRTAKLSRQRIRRLLFCRRSQQGFGHRLANDRCILEDTAIHVKFVAWRRA